MTALAPTGVDPGPEPQAPLAPGPVTQHTRWRIGVKMYGIVFLVVVASLVALAIASFHKAFTPVVMVTLETNRIGSQLQESSDVKIRGLIVGEVRTIEVTPTGAKLGLALQPDEVSKIPADVSARLLPKTLFGERYVDLVTPPTSSGRPIAEGDVIGQDRSRVSIELETVLDDLYPLLRTVQPAKLATTLNALSTTLDGRGEEIGENLVTFRDYLKAINPKMPVLQQDITLLADTLDVYTAAVPDVFRLTESLRVTNKTIVEKDQQLAAFLVGTAGFANTTAGFLRDNESRIIQVGQVTRPTTQLLAKYSPIYPCLSKGMVDWVPRAREAFGSGQVHLTIEIVPPRNPYTVGEGPQWLEKAGPDCAGLPSPGGSQAHPYLPRRMNDGSNAPVEGSMVSGVLSGLPSAFLGDAGNADSGSAGTVEEQQLIGALLATDDHAQPSGIQTLLAGPLLRGGVVSNR